MKIQNVCLVCNNTVGVLYKYINRQLTLIILLIIMSVSTAYLPYCPNIWIAYLCSFFGNVGSGAWDDGNNVWLIEMWKKRSPVVMQFSQFMYGVGCILGPLLDEPFLTGEIESNTTNTSTNISISTPISIINTTETDRLSKIKIPFLVNGIIQGIIPVVLLIMFFVKSYNPPKVELKTEDMSKSTEILDTSEKFSSHINIINSESGQNKLLITLITLCIGIYSSLELAHFGYSPTYYQNMDLKISASKAAQILSAMATTFTIGRCVSAFIAIKIKPDIMIIYHFCIISIAMAVLYFMQNSVTFIWIGNLIIGFGFSAMWPGIFAFTEQYVKVTNKVGTVLIFSCGIAPLFSPFILGPYIEDHPSIFLEFEFAYLIATITLYIIILYIVKRPNNQQLIIINK